MYCSLRSKRSCADRFAGHARWGAGLGLMGGEIARHQAGVGAALLGASSDKIDPAWTANGGPPTEPRHATSKQWSRTRGENVTTAPVRRAGRSTPALPQWVA